MPDRRSHRGPHPEDPSLFSANNLPALRSAVHDLSWLLTRSYAQPSALKLVGDRYTLNQRQRIAVMRSACSDQSLQTRRAAQLSPDALASQTLLIDGYNLLTTLEAALAGAVILHARDGCFRDIASLHGTWRRVDETRPVLSLLADCLADLHVNRCHWLLDSPVSNSGRLKTILLQVAGERHWDWQVDLVPNPDPILAKSSDPIVTADSAILDASPPWFNLAPHIITNKIPTTWLLNLST